MQGTVIATARKKETEAGFPDYIEKAEMGAIGRALVICGYGKLKRRKLMKRIGSLIHPVEKNKAN